MDKKPAALSPVAGGRVQGREARHRIKATVMMYMCISSEKRIAGVEQTCRIAHEEGEVYPRN